MSLSFPIRPWSVTAASIGIGILMACGDPPEDNDDHDDDGLTLEEDVCLHAQEDTPIPRTASLDINDVDSGSDNISHTHTFYEIELPDNSDGDYEGYLAFGVESADRYGLFVNTELDVEFVDDAGDSLGEMTVDDFDACPDIVAQYSLQLSAGDHFVHFGPTDQATIYVVTETVP